jgi:hypothetical protein
LRLVAGDERKPLRRCNRGDPEIVVRQNAPGAANVNAEPHPFVEAPLVERHHKVRGELALGGCDPLGSPSSLDHPRSNLAQRERCDSEDCTRNPIYICAWPMGVVVRVMECALTVTEIARVAQDDFRGRDLHLFVERGDESLEFGV